MDDFRLFSYKQPNLYVWVGNDFIDIYSSMYFATKCGKNLRKSPETAFSGFPKLTCEQTVSLGWFHEFLPSFVLLFSSYILSISISS